MHAELGVAGISLDEFIKTISKINRESIVSVEEKYRSIPRWWNGEIENKGNATDYAAS